MSAALFYWTGALAWLLAALYIAARLLVPLAQTTSYYTVCIVASVRHNRWRLVTWRKLPAHFVANWWKWLWDGAPDRITGPYLKWEGTFKWHIVPTRAAAAAPPEGKEKP